LMPDVFKFVAYQGKYVSEL
jgi:hypothetical protein